MKPGHFFSKNKSGTQFGLLLIMTFTPILMFLGAKANSPALILIGLGLMILANLAAALTR